MSRAIRLDEDNQRKVARAFLWVEDVEKVPDCLRLLEEQDVDFVKKIRVQGDAYGGGEWSTEVENLGTVKVQERYSVQCLTKEEI
eukprot:51697-Eustigmatos_ZCMA.PRE.1